MSTRHTIILRGMAIIAATWTIAYFIAAFGTFKAYPGDWAGYVRWSVAAVWGICAYVACAYVSIELSE